MSDKQAAGTIESQYVRISECEHILQCPDIYIGSVQPLTEKMWVYEANPQQMVHKTIKYSPGFFKIFDEILVNAVDNKKNYEPENLLQMNTISVNFDKD